MVIQCCSGIKNSGDEAILKTLIRQYVKEYDITVISQNFQYTSKMHESIKTCENHRSCCDAVRGCDIFVLGGGGLLQDETTVYNVFRWLRYLRRAIRLGKITVIYANSIGPLSWRINRWLVKKYLSQVDLITLRDESSAELLKQIGVCSKITVTADVAFSFLEEEEASGESNTYGQEANGYVCMALRHWYDIHPLIPVSVCNKLHIRSRKNKRLYNTYIQTMAEVTQYINEVWKKKVVFVTFLYGRDGKVSRDILALAGNKNNEIIEDEYMEPEKVINIIRQADILIGMRLHSIIYAICTSTPVLPVVYSAKVGGIVKLNRLKPYSISMEELNPDRVIMQLNQVWQDSEKQKSIMREQYAIMRAKEKENQKLLKGLTQKQRIVMVGPVFPYKGGISHYTGLMCKALREKYHVTMISYKMQYPQILFKKEQRDYTNDSFAVEDTQYLIHTANLFNIAVSAGKIKKERPDLVILQWWHPYFAPCYWILIRCLRLILPKCPVLLVCHNVYPHERFPMDRFLTRLVLRQADYYLVQSKKDEKDLLGIIENARYERVVHPTYDSFNMTGINREEARIRLGVSNTDPVILFFGFVRKYKGLHHLLKAMPEIVSRISHIRLLIAGDFGEDRDEYLEEIEKYENTGNILLKEGYCPDREVELYFSACNLVVLPYEEATQSGIAQIAFGFGRPVIATEVGGLPEVVSEAQTGYIVPPSDPKALAEAIIRFFIEKREEEFVANISREAKRFSWDRMTEEIEKLTGLNGCKNEKIS